MIKTFPLDHNGFVVNTGDLTKITEPYLSIVQDLVTTIKQKLANDCVAIYVRGSVITGEARPPYSDVDLVVITRKSIGSHILRWRVELEIAFEEAYKILEMIDITVASLEEIKYNSKYTNLPIYLQTASALIIGRDIRAQFNRVKPGPDLARNMFVNIIPDLEEKRYQLKNNIPTLYLDIVRPQMFTAVWCMRFILRSSLGLVMFHEPIFTPDLKTCAHICSKYYPSLSSYMNQALDWAIKPPQKISLVIDYLDNFLPYYKKIWNNLLATSN